MYARSCKHCRPPGLTSCSLGVCVYERSPHHLTPSSWTTFLLFSTPIYLLDRLTQSPYPCAAPNMSPTPTSPATASPSLTSPVLASSPPLTPAPTPLVQTSLAHGSRTPTSPAAVDDMALKSTNAGVKKPAQKKTKKAGFKTSQKAKVALQKINDFCTCRHPA